VMPTKPGHGLRAVGVVWYRKADWPRLRALLADADKLPDTYAECTRPVSTAAALVDVSGAV
jgi:hypothetical protein